ncbi:MAG TPA: gluconeogenesis factor YvcK family protein, partial [Acidobacteriota bacterium]|nr:gluconeogenesis factor YvcK family protein [Acidobacteriota bacterium]
AIISMADNGGSTGKLRAQYGVSAMGDIRKCLVALSQSPFKTVFTFRYTGGPYAGHSGGNLILSQLELELGSFERAISHAKQMLNVPEAFDVLPSTLEKVTLHAKLADGTHLIGETTIDTCNAPRAPIEKVWLQPDSVIYERARDVIQSADMIVIGPGDFYTSIIPNFLVEGVSDAVKQSRAKKMYIGALATKLGETDGFSAQDFVSRISQYSGRLDYVMFNSQMPTSRVVGEYTRRGSALVVPRAPRHTGWICTPLLSDPNIYPLDTAPLVAKHIMKLLK